MTCSEFPSVSKKKARKSYKTLHLLTILVTLTSPSGSEPETVHTLTVCLEPDGRWKCLGRQVA